MTSLGDKIAHHRERLGLSVQDLAVLAGMTNAHLSAIEDGTCLPRYASTINIPILAALSRALGVSPLIMAAAAFDDLETGE
jgi:transcriptional regulator with XRE-family HTH domain